MFGHKEFKEKEIDSHVIWSNLKTKYNVFLIHKPFHKKAQDIEAVKQWKDMIGEERVLIMNTPKACVDVMLGAIAITSFQWQIDDFARNTAASANSNVPAQVERDHLRLVVGVLGQRESADQVRSASHNGADVLRKRVPF